MGFPVQEAGGVVWPSQELVDIPCRGGHRAQDTSASPTVRSTSWRYSPYRSLSEAHCRLPDQNSAPPPPRRPLPEGHFPRAVSFQEHPCC